MSKKIEKIFVIAMIAVVIFAFFYLLEPTSLLGSFLQQFSQVNWDKVNEVDIIKNSIPITLLENLGSECKVDAHNFDLIIDYEFFIRQNELAKELNYDRENETLMLPCDLLKGEKSRLNIWYVVEESTLHSKKYQYFVTEWNDEKS